MITLGLVLPTAFKKTNPFICLSSCTIYRRWHLPSPFLLTFRLTGMENQFLFSKHFFLENKTRKSKVVKLHLISGEPVSIMQCVDLLSQNQCFNECQPTFWILQLRFEFCIFDSKAKTWNPKMVHFTQSTLKASNSACPWPKQL